MYIFVLYTYKYTNTDHFYRNERPASGLCKYDASVSDLYKYNAPNAIIQTIVIAHKHFYVC